MNERIQALAVEAEDYADSIVDQGGEFHEEYTRKLAELIVAECVYAVEHTNDRHRRDYFAAKIREHFGVEQ